MKHPHYATIVAWAEGKKVQVKNASGQWHTFQDHNTPSWSLDNEYRVKPDGLKYRIGLYKCPDEIVCFMCINEEQEQQYGEHENFIKWVTDWQEVELGE